MSPPPKISFLASDAEKAQQALKRLTARYGTLPVEAADIIVALGGAGWLH